MSASFADAPTLSQQIVWLTSWQPYCWHTSLMHLSVQRIAHCVGPFLLTTFLSLQYNYLMQFDYLPKSDLETGALRTEEQLIDAISKLQVCSCQIALHATAVACHVYYAQADILRLHATGIWQHSSYGQNRPGYGQANTEAPLRCGRQ